MHAHTHARKRSPADAAALENAHLHHPAPVHLDHDNGYVVGAATLLPLKEGRLKHAPRGGLGVGRGGHDVAHLCGWAEEEQATTP